MKDPNPFALAVLIAKQSSLKRLHKNPVEYDQMLLAAKLKVAKLIFSKQLPPDKEGKLIFSFFAMYILNFQKLSLSLN